MLFCFRNTILRKLGSTLNIIVSIQSFHYIYQAFNWVLVESLLLCFQQLILLWFYYVISFWFQSPTCDCCFCMCVLMCPPFKKKVVLNFLFFRLSIALESISGKATYKHVKKIVITAITVQRHIPASQKQLRRAWSKATEKCGLEEGMISGKSWRSGRKAWRAAFRPWA